MGRVVWEGGGFPGLGLDECFEDDEGDSVAFAGCKETEGASLCCVWMRVLTTSKGVVMTPAMPPALAAVNISSGNPMLFDPT